MAPDWMCSNGDDLDQQRNKGFLNRCKVHSSALEHAVHVEAPDEVSRILSRDDCCFWIEPTEGEDSTCVPEEDRHWNENHRDENHVLVAELCTSFEVATSVCLTNKGG